MHVFIFYFLLIAFSILVYLLFSYLAFRLQECSIKSVSQSVSIAPLIRLLPAKYTTPHLSIYSTRLRPHNSGSQNITILVCFGTQISGMHHQSCHVPISTFCCTALYAITIHHRHTDGRTDGRRARSTSAPRYRGYKLRV